MLQVTHINKLLQVIVQIGQVFSSFLVLGNQFLLPLQQLLALLLQRLTLDTLVFYAGNHESVLISVDVLWVFGEKLFDGNEW